MIRGDKRMRYRASALKNELTLFQKCLSGLILAVIFLIMVIPMWNVIVMSTSTALDASASGIKLWWNKFSIDGYKYIFEVAKLGRPFLNSLFVSTVGVVFQVALSAFAGYVLIQHDLPGKKLVTSFVMLTMMVPGDLTLISIYQMNKQLGLLNSYTGLIVNGLISGFSILVMRNYFIFVPQSLAESSRLDGASEFKIFAGIYLPLSIPGLATVFFMEFVAKWNSIMLPATLVTNQELFTLPLILKSLILQTGNSTSGTDLAPNNAIMAAVLVSMAPLLVIYIFAQQFLISGLALGSSKE